MTAEGELAGLEAGFEQTFVLPERIAAPPRLSERFPVLYPWAVRAHRLIRWVAWLRSDAMWAVRRAAPPTPDRVKEHKSLLLRQLGESEMWLQHNKVTNLRLAAGLVDGVVIRPGETFSFNKVVGNCTRRRGFVDGMKLSNGEADAGVGGGICQLANLLVWMFMHSDLTVVERSEHSFDPFPDNGRVLPWGVGCSIVYNYVDLVVRNDTTTTFVLHTRVGEKYLEGELRCDTEPQHSYSVRARNEMFLRRGDDVFRRNEIHRTVIDRRTGDRIGEELLRANCALVKYHPVDVPIHDIL
jgi:vancomycin resistance protein VanW